MFSNRKRYNGSFHYVILMSYWSAGRRFEYNGVNLWPSDMSFLGAVLYWNLTFNDFCPLKSVRELLGRGWSIGETVDRLLGLGLVSRPKHGSFVLTPEGEYFLRDVETRLSRIAQNKPLGKWRKIVSKDDPRLAYVRPKQVKDSFVVRNPKDVRMIAKRVKAGLVPVWTEPIKKDDSGQ